jgi:RNA polymerase sigma-70 factor (ECF subfamily)
MTRLEFNNHVLQLSRRLYITAFRFLRKQEEAEDAVQEIFMRLWNRKEELDRYNSIEALAMTTVRNYCIDMLRRNKTRAIEENVEAVRILSAESQPDEIVERNESAEILNRIISRLPTVYRNLIVMKEIDGLSYDEIAEITGQNLNTLRVNLSRARKMIRDEFKKNKYEYAGNTGTSGKVL